MRAMSVCEEKQLSPIAVTMGEPAGIGGEIICKAWLRRGDYGLMPFFVIDDPNRLADVSCYLGESLPIQTISTPAEAAAVFTKALPVLPKLSAIKSIPGKPDPTNAMAVIASIKQAVVLARDGHAAAVVTNPIHKKTLYTANFPYPGHTEFLAALAGGNIRPVMMLACPNLRVVTVTAHVSLRQAIATLKTVDIIACGRTTARALQSDFGITNPRLAVAALNPHAGESGSMGKEEDIVIRPAIEALQGDGIAVLGPVSADTLFYGPARTNYDAALCMYHDQAMIPLKTIDFNYGVNITLGLPFVRTSPDHGTALDIAGSGQADEASLIQALLIAQKIATRRMMALLATTLK